jgi:hypothetical protein
VAVISSVECGRRPGGRSLYLLRKKFRWIDNEAKRLEEESLIKPDNPDFSEKVNRNSAGDDTGDQPILSSRQNNGS